MAKRILVPLDRSVAAESVVSLVGDLVRGSGAAVRLLYVAPRPDNQVDDAGRVIAYADQEMASLQSEGLDYLRAMEFVFGDQTVDSVVRFGDPVREILREADDFGADLIAVTTARRSCVTRALLGSVAEAVFRRAHVPVLLYGPAPLA